MTEFTTHTAQEIRSKLWVMEQDVFASKNIPNELKARIFMMVDMVREFTKELEGITISSNQHQIENVTPKVLKPSGMTFSTEEIDDDLAEVKAEEEFYRS